MSGSREFRAEKRRECRGGGYKEEEEGGGAGARGYDGEVNSFSVGTTRRQGHRPRVSLEKGDDACLRDDGVSSSNAGGNVIGRNAHEGENCSRDVWSGEGSCYVRRLRDWGVVTACSGVVVPHQALDVRYYDLLSTLEAETLGGKLPFRLLCSISLGQNVSCAVLSSKEKTAAHRKFRTKNIRLFIVSPPDILFVVDWLCDAC